MAQSCLDKVPVLFATMKPVSIRFHLRQWGPLLAHYWICLIAIIGPIKKSCANDRCTLLAQSRHCNVILACIDSPITRIPVKSKRNINGPLCPCLLGCFLMLIYSHLSLQIAGNAHCDILRYIWLCCWLYCGDLTCRLSRPSSNWTESLIDGSALPPGSRHVRPGSARSLFHLPSRKPDV